MNRCFVWVLGGVLVVVGCGGGAAPMSTGGAGSGGPGGAGGGGAPTTAQAFCQQVQGVIAANAARCYGGTVADWSAPPDWCQTIGKLTTTIQYDAAKAKDCLATLSATSMTECLPNVPCLDEALKGLIPNGQACTHSAECGPGVNCQSTDNTTCVQPVCAAPAPVGAPCVPYCDDNGVCDPATNLCVAIVEVDVGGSCGDPGNRFCKSGLDCVYVGDATAGTCELTPPKTGCEVDFECDFYLEFCDLTVAGTGTCKPRITMGAPCTDHPNGCQITANCDPVTNRCAKAGHPGERCASSIGFCFTGFCDGSDPDTARCVALAPLGARCDTGYECKSGVCRNQLCTDCPR